MTLSLSLTPSTKCKRSTLNLLQLTNIYRTRSKRDKTKSGKFRTSFYLGASHELVKVVLWSISTLFPHTSLDIITNFPWILAQPYKKNFKISDILLIWFESYTKRKYPVPNLVLDGITFRLKQILEYLNFQ